MTIESDVFTALRGLVADKVYPDVNDEGTAAPYIVYTRTGGVTPVFLEPAAPSKEMIRVRVVCWHTSRLSAVALGKSAEDALLAIGAKPIGDAISLYDETTKLRGASRDYIVVSDR